MFANFYHNIVVCQFLFYVHFFCQKIDTYLLTQKFSQKWQTAFSYFRKMFHLRCLTGFWGHFCMLLKQLKWVRNSLISLYNFFSYQGFLSDTDNSQDSRGREGTISYSTLPLPPTHKHWDIYLQLCMWDDYHIFLITMLVFTRLLLDVIYHLIELPFDWLTDNAMFVYLMNWF